MNGFSAADMSTAAANGHAEGYQAGCADAVKAVEAGGSPEADARTQIRNAFFKGVARTCDEVAPGIILSVAAQEAVAWQLRYARPAPDGSRYEWHEISREQYLEATKGKWASAYELRELFDRPAPVAAAPVDLHAHLLHMLGAKDHEDAGRIIGELHAASMSTPAAPGIDLREPMRNLYQAYVRLLESGMDRITSLGGDCDPVDVMEANDIDLRAAREALDASPKGDDCETCKGRGIFNTNGNGPWDCYACGKKGNHKGAAPEFQVPSGWALVPDRMQLTPENMEILADTLRGADEDEPWCGGVLWIGQTTDDDGEPTYYGLNVGNVECLEEGSTNIVEFAPSPQDSPKGGSTDAEPKIWGTQRPGDMPKLFGAHHIAELNWYPDEGYDLICMQIIERVQATSHGAGVSE